MKFNVPNFRKKPKQEVEVLKPTVNEKVDAIIEDKSSVAVKAVLKELQTTVEAHKEDILKAVTVVGVAIVLLRTLTGRKTVKHGQTIINVYHGTANIRFA